MIVEDCLNKSVFCVLMSGLFVLVNIKEGEIVIVGIINIIGLDLMLVVDLSVILVEFWVDEIDIVGIKLD